LPGVAQGIAHAIDYRQTHSLEAAMKALFVSVAFGVGALFGASAYAQAPAGAIAQCKDGTYFTGTSHKGACKGHQGVKEWLDKTASSTSGTAASDSSTTKKSKKSKTADKTTAAPAATAAPAPAPAPTAAPAPAKTAPASSSTHTPPTPASQIQQKAGGGAGQVWVNSGSKVYHCQGDEWYGKTKEGSYMTEAAAKAAGNHAAHGKECGS
jgi:cell division septation protein DedD